MIRDRVARKTNAGLMSALLLLAALECFAAAAPMAAHTPSPTRAWKRALEDLPMRVFHGTADESAPFSLARAMVDALKAEGFDVQLDAIQGANHGALTRLYGQPDLYDWFLTHRRD